MASTVNYLYSLVAITLHRTRFGYCYDVSSFTMHGFVVWNGLHGSKAVADDCRFDLFDHSLQHFACEQTQQQRVSGYPANC